jgi:RND family efflux transporter MFP subunit
MESWPRTILVQGSLLDDEQAVIGAKMAGRVQEVLVDLGTPVKKGDPLVVLDRRELELRVRQAEAQLAQACAAIGRTPQDDELQMKREQSPPVMLEQALVDEARAAIARADTLRPRGVVTESEYERLQSLLKTAQARYRSALNNVGEQIALIGVRRTELAIAQQQFDEAQIVAPFDSVVQLRMVSPGEYVQVGQAVATLVRADTLRFTAGVPESRAAEVRKGQTVHLTLPGIEKPVVSAVTRISPMVTQTSRSLLIEADVDNRSLHLRAGQFAEGEIIVNRDEQVLAVPAAAVSQFAGVQKVWLVRDGQASEQPISIGRRDLHRVEVLAGISAGDFIVSNASDGKPGAVVAVEAKQDAPRQAEHRAEDQTGLFE